MGGYVASFITLPLCLSFLTVDLFSMKITTDSSDSAHEVVPKIVFQFTAET
jgi:hypothetical protein